SRNSCTRRSRPTSATRRGLRSCGRGSRRRRIRREVSMLLFRGRRFRALAAGIALLLAPRAAHGDDEVAEGKRAVVTAPAGLRAVAEAARDALEKPIPVYEAALPYRLPAAAKLNFRLCSDPAEYRAIVERSGAPDLVEAMAATLWHTADSVVVIVP